MNVALARKDKIGQGILSLDRLTSFGWVRTKFGEEWLKTICSRGGEELEQIFDQNRGWVWQDGNGFFSQVSKVGEMPTKEEVEFVVKKFVYHYRTAPKSLVFVILE